METNDQIVLSKKDVFHIVFQDLRTCDFEITDFSLKPIGETATGFLGEHKRLEVTINFNESEKKLTYFVKKTSNEAPTQKEFLEKTGCFLKEIGMYKTIFKEFDKVLPENIIKWRPNYFLSKGLDLFVIEDLTALGYYLFPERSLVDKEHVLATLKSLAAMHASSLILEERLKQGKLKLDSPTPVCENSNLTIWDLYQDLLFEGDFPDGLEEFSHIHHETAIKAEIQLVDHLPTFTEREKTMIKKKLPNAMRRVFELVKPSNKYRNVIAHGDLWANNVLFKKVDGKVQEAVLIDYQLYRYAPPATDIVMFLHLVQSRQFREKNQNELFSYYYNIFSQLLEKQGLDAKELFPWEEFRSSCDYYEELGCVACLFFFQPILSPPEISNKFLKSPELFYKFWLVDRNDMILECFLSDSICRQRVTEALTEFIQKFVLK